MNDFNLDFSSLKPTRIPVKGPDGNDYLLCEAGGDAGAKFKDAKTASIRFESGKAAGTTGMGHLEPLLVSLCLHNVKRGSDGKPLKNEAGEMEPTLPVARKLIGEWPYSSVKKLYNAALKISELDDIDSLEDLRRQRDALDRRISELEQGDTPVKNSQSSTEAGFE